MFVTRNEPLFVLKVIQLCKLAVLPLSKVVVIYLVIFIKGKFWEKMQTQNVSYSQRDTRC